MSDWLRRALSAEHLRPHARFGLLAIGVLTGSLALVAWLMTRASHVPYPSRYYHRGESASLLGWVALGVILLVGVMVVSSTLRARSARRVEWWESNAALLVVCGAYGAGNGLLCTWLLENRIDQALFLGFCAGVLGTLVVSAVERGRLPVAGILLAIAAATVAALGRIALVSRIGRWDEEQVLVAALAAVIVFPLAYLLIRGLLILVAGRSDDSGQGLFSQPPPFEVRSLGDRFQIRVEAPGLRDADGLTVAVGERSVEIVAPARKPPSEGLMFSTRTHGPLHTRVVLPEPVAPPATFQVADGLIAISVARATPVGSPSPEPTP